MTALFEIDVDRFEVKLTERDRALLTDYSVSTVQFTDEGERLGWTCKPIVSSEGLAKLAHLGPRIVRTIANASTASLAAFGQRTTTVVNERCNVAVAGLGLLTVNEVEVHTDFCTEALQDKLNEGWRILAVCVQPDQRRPDYVLGRTRGDKGP